MLLCSFDHTECIEGVHHAAIGIHVLGSNICEKHKTAANSQTPLINMLNYVDILVSCLLAVKIFHILPNGPNAWKHFQGEPSRTSDDLGFIVVWIQGSTPAARP